MERLKPLNDFIFKKTFGEEETKDNLIALLNAILSKKDIDKLVTLEIVENKQLTPELIEDKTGIIDVRAKTADGTQLEIEVQLTNQHNMDKRTLWYWGEIYSNGIKKGEDKLQRWLSFFREDISKEELEELMDMDADIKKAEEKIKYLSSDPETLALYKARERSLHERANMISSAKEEGREEGREEGANEKAIKLAKNFLKMGLTVKQVAEGSELPLEKVIELKKQMSN